MAVHRQSWNAETLARLLSETGVTPAALMAYEGERLEVVNTVVLANRRQPPDTIIETVEQRSGGRPFAQLEDVIQPSELEAISDRYKQIAGYDLKKT